MGIDPGKTGALALFEWGRLIEVVDMPTVEVEVSRTRRQVVSPGLLANYFKSVLPEMVYFEKVGVRPKEGAVGAFSFGRGVGTIEGIMAALEIPYQMVLPAVWKKSFDLPSEKDVARQHAIAIFPEHAKLFARKKDDGRAEASLIGLYGVRKNGLADENRKLHS